MVELQGLRVLLDPLDLQVLLVRMVMTAQLHLLAPLVALDLPDLLAPTVALAYPALLGPLEVI